MDSLLGRVPAHWWVGPGPGPLAGEVRSWNKWGKMGSYCLLVDGALSPPSQFLDLGYPRTGADWQVDGARSQY